MDVAITELNEDSILNLVSQVSIIKRQIERYFLTVLFISNLVTDLMNHFYDHRQYVSSFCVMYLVICIYQYTYICVYVCMYT